MTTQDLRQVLANYGKCEIVVTNHTELSDGATLWQFDFDDYGTATAITYGDYVVTQADWQSGYPTSEEEIADYQWVDIED